MSEQPLTSPLPGEEVTDPAVSPDQDVDQQPIPDLDPEEALRAVATGVGAGLGVYLTPANADPDTDGADL